MADLGEKAAKQLGEITECPICKSEVNDPRMLPCIHSFCLECIKRTAEADQKKPGDVMPCPLCRKDFVIPADGVNGLQRNFFMENLLEFKTMLLIGNVVIICDMCNVRNEGKPVELPTATMRCIECQDNYCDSCVKVHQFQKLSRNHEMVKIGNETASEMKRSFTSMYCTEHPQKPLDYYCADCKKIVCVSCCVESHSSHKCKDVTKVDKEFRKTIQRNLSKVSIYADDMLSLRKKAEIIKADFLQEIAANENAIHKRNQELKDMIDKHTKSLLNELSVIKSKNLKEIETNMHEIDRCCTVFRSFEVYCKELVSKGSASDICSSVDQLLVRADELGADRKAFIGRPHQSKEISFQTTDLSEVLQKSNNFLGQLKEATSKFQNFVFVVGINDSSTITGDVVKINLHRPNDISTHGKIPTKMATEAVAAVYCNTMYVSGIGVKADEIWKCSESSGWKKCASLVQGRCGHSAAFINEVLYICGGLVYSNQTVLDSVEAFNAVTDKCNTVGKLVHCVQKSGNCVPFRSSLYIFGGKDKYHNDLGHVQMYNTKQNTCTLLTTPMPHPSFMMRAVLWETFAILVGQKTCFIFDFQAGTWQERDQFKTEVRYFGLVLENERVFVIGGGDNEMDKAVKKTWQCRDDVRYVPLQNILQDKSIEWKTHGKLPKPSLVQAYGVLGMTA